MADDRTINQVLREIRSSRRLENLTEEARPDELNMSNLHPDTSTTAQPPSLRSIRATINDQGSSPFIEGDFPVIRYKKISWYNPTPIFFLNPKERALSTILGHIVGKRKYDKRRHDEFEKESLGRIPYIIKELEYIKKDLEEKKGVYAQEKLNKLEERLTTLEKSGDQEGLEEVTRLRDKQRDFVDILEKQNRGLKDTIERYKGIQKDHIDPSKYKLYGKGIKLRIPFLQEFQAYSRSRDSWNPKFHGVLSNEGYPVSVDTEFLFRPLEDPYHAQRILFGIANPEQQLASMLYGGTYDWCGSTIFDHLISLENTDIKEFLIRKYADEFRKTGYWLDVAIIVKVEPNLEMMEAYKQKGASVARAVTIRNIGKADADKKLYDFTAEAEGKRRMERAIADGINYRGTEEANVDLLKQQKDAEGIKARRKAYDTKAGQRVLLQDTAEKVYSNVEQTQIIASEDLVGGVVKGFGKGIKEVNDKGVSRGSILKRAYDLLIRKR